MKKLLLSFFLVLHLSVYAQFPDVIGSAQLPASNGMILALIDYNNDEFTDVVYQNGLGGNIEIFGNKNGVFSNVSAQLGFPLIAGNGQGTEGVYAFDYNQDGFKDLLYAQSGANGAMRLFKNNCGVNFTEVSGAANMPVNTTIVAQYQSLNPIILFSDVDKDNDIDILFSRFIGGQFHISLLRNAGSSFANPVNVISGFGASTIPNFALIDFNNDRNEDLLVISNTGFSNAGAISLFENNGAGLYSLFSGTTGITNSSPVGFAQILDYNHDGFQDILLGSKDTVQPTPSVFSLKVYRNTNGTGAFSDQSANFNSQSTLLGDYFNAHAFDYNNDGRTDLLWEIKNTSGASSKPALMRYNGGTSFTSVQNTFIPSATTDTNITANYVLFDYDNDGKVDIFQPGGGSSPNARLLKNISLGNNYVSIRLRSCTGPTDPVGSRVYAKFGPTTTHRTYSGQSNTSTQAYGIDKLYFGLGSASQIDSLVIAWPNGSISRLAQISANQHLLVSDGTCNLGQTAQISFASDSLALCNTPSTPLIAPSGFASYLWSNSETTQSISVTETNWYQCTATLSNGCKASDSIFVSLGNALILQKDTTIFPTQSITLDAWPRNNCGPFGAPINRVVNANDNLGPDLQYIGSLNGHHYYKFTAPSTWTEAETRALALGGHLATINNQAENDFLSTDPNLSGNNIWIGYYRSTVPGSAFNWVNCDTTTYTNWAVSSSSPSAIPSEQHTYIRASGCPDAGQWKNTDESQLSIDPCESTFFGLIEFDNSKILSYLWNTSETTPSITVAPATTRSYSVQVNQNNAICNANITVSVLKTSSIINLDTLTECQANSVLIGANLGWDTYVWNTSETTRSITVTASGWYKVTVTYGAFIGSDSIYVNLNNASIATADTTVCAGTSILVKGPTPPYVLQTQYTQNFQTAPFTNWNKSSNFTYNSTKVLGPFANDSVALGLSALPIHDSVTVSFDVYIHDTWDGDCSVIGSDRFIFKNGNQTLLNTTFSTNPTCTQSYASSGIAGSYAANTGAIQTNLPFRCNLNGSTSKYTITRTFAHSSANLNISFIGNLIDTADNSLLCDESWSLDNIQVHIRKLDKVLWSTGDTTQNITVTPVNPINKYWVRVPISGGFCYDTLTVSTNPSPPNGALFTSDSIKVCKQNAVALSLPAGLSTYTWSNGANTRNTSVYNSGWVRARVTSMPGACAAVDSIYIDKNKVGLTFTDTSICKNSVLELKADLNNNATPFVGPAETNYTPAQSLAGYSYLGAYQGHYYYRSNTRTRWTQAAQNALNAGGHLVNILDSAEQRFIESIADSNVWIGLFKPAGGAYTWMNEDTLVYTNWAVSQPGFSPKDYVYMPGKFCGNRKWKSHTDSDTLSLIPCESTMFGLLEIYPVSYSYLWTNTEFTKNIFINPQADSLVGLEVSKIENGHANTCNAGTANVNVYDAPVIIGSTKICNSNPETYTTALNPGSSYSWIVLGGNIVSGQNTNTISVVWNTAGFGGIEVIDSIKSVGCVNRSGFVSVEVVLFPEPSIKGDTISCANTSKQYTVVGDTSYIYTWNVTGGSIVSGQGNDTVLVSWGSAGTGNIRLSINDKWNGCSANSALVEVDIFANPNPIITGTDTACKNTVSTYSTSSTAGRIYTWQVTNGTIASGQGTASVNIIWGNASNGSIQLVDSNTLTGCKGNAPTFNVVLEDTPTPSITGNTAVCSNTTHAYSTPASAGRWYQWTVSNGIILSGQGTSNISVLWNASGTGTLIVQDSVIASGCKALSDLVIVNISNLPTPIISGPSTICANNTANYTTPSNTGRTYRWTITGGTLLSGQGTASIQVSWTAPGTGTVTVNDSINSSGCNANATPYNVLVNSAPIPVVSGNIAACVGGIVSYTTSAGPNNNYNWTIGNGTILSGQGSNFILVSWPNAGAGTVEVRDSNRVSSCAVSSAALNVSISPISNIDITGSQTVCGGSIASYTIPRNANRSYAWTVTGGSIASGQGTDSIVVFWPSGGSGSINVRDSNQISGCVAINNPFTVTINNFDLPIISGPSSVCIGSEITYKTPFNAGRTYRWDVSGGIIQSGQGTDSVVVLWGFLGVGTVSVFDSVDATGCNGTSIPLAITVTDKPTAIISGASNLCTDAVANYGTFPNANKVFVWSVLGGSVLFGQGTSMATISWDVPGTGYVFLYDSLIGSSCAAFAVKEVSVNPIPSAAFTVSQAMGGVTLTPAEPGLQCKWYFGDGDSSTQYSPKHFYAANGTYTINLTVKSLKGCVNASSTDVNMNTVSIAKNMANGNITFTAYPNPFKGETTLALHLNQLAEIGLDLYDMSGRHIAVLAEPKQQSAGNYAFPMDTKSMQISSGIFLVRLKVDEQYHYIKLIAE